MVKKKNGYGRIEKRMPSHFVNEWAQKRHCFGSNCCCKLAFSNAQQQFSISQRERDGAAREAWRDERIAAPPRQPLCDGLVEGVYEGLYNYVNRLRKEFIS